MGIQHHSLDQATRTFMIQEVALGNHYVSPRLTVQGRAAWPGLLHQAATNGNDDWLAAQLLQFGHVLHQEDYTRNGVTRQRAINQPHAAAQLAEGEFNRYYIRGLCLRARAAGVPQLVVYRGKAVEKPRPESEAKIGTMMAVETLLAVLRSNDFVSIDGALGVPSGPSSGLSCRLP